METAGDLIAHLWKTSRGMKQDCTVSAAFNGILLEPSRSRVGFIVSNPFPAPMHLGVEMPTVDDEGAVLQGFTGPYFFTLHNTYGAVRQRWCFRFSIATVGARFTVIDLQAGTPL